MEDGLIFFFDSYALIEIFQGNLKFEKYKSAKIVTTFFQVYEMYYSLIRNGYSEEDVSDYFNYLKGFCVKLDFDLIPRSVRFRRENYSRGLSYADCLGYVISRKMGIRFLTGDKEFVRMSGVEFVRK